MLNKTERYRQKNLFSTNRTYKSSYTICPVHNGTADYAKFSNYHYIIHIICNSAILYYTTLLLFNLATTGYTRQAWYTLYVYTIALLLKSLHYTAAAT